MQPLWALASSCLLAVVASGAAPPLYCVCRHLDAAATFGGATSGLTVGEFTVRKTYCRERKRFYLLGACDTLKPPSAVVPAVATLARTSEPPPPAGGGEDDCSAALAAIRALTEDEAWRLLSQRLLCLLTTGCLDSYYSVHGLNGTEWNATALLSGEVRRRELSRSLQAFRRISRAIDDTSRLSTLYTRHLKDNAQQWSQSRFQVQMAGYLEHFSSYWRDSAQLLSLGVEQLSQLLLPLAFELMGNHTSGPRLDGWIKDMARVRNMLQTKLRGWVYDAQSVSQQVADYRMEEDKNSPGNYIIRRPVVNEDLLDYQLPSLSYYHEFNALCKQQHPEATQMFGLADAVYFFYRRLWFGNLRQLQDHNSSYFHVVDEQWQLEDRSNATLSVDTDCLQLLVDALDRPACPLEEVPPLAARQRQQCRAQLWEDLVGGPPHLPVTSYLAYTQRASVNLCLLAWMVSNSFGICEDVPFSIMQSVHDALCYFDRPGDLLCPKSNATDSICVVSRAILLLKCRDFSSQGLFDQCFVKITSDGLYSAVYRTQLGDYYIWNKKPTKITFSYKDSLSNSTLRYKNFKIDSLKPLEISLIAGNIIFRFLTAVIYMYLRHLRNLPGKIFLSYQITGIIQVLCSEIMYRMVGVPDLSTAVLIDSVLTLLSCLWLNSFCYQMYACLRHLRLPDDLLPSESRKAFCRQVLYALIPWSAVCVATIALERTSKYNLIYSRILLLVGISLSVVFNLLCLGLVGHLYLLNKKSMTQLKIYSKDKFASKKQLFFMTVKTVILSGIGVIIRSGFHQAQGVAQFVYYVHLATMLQGPVLFIFFICNETTLPILRNHVLSWWNPDVINPEQELCSSAERNLGKRVNMQSPAAESSL